VNIDERESKQKINEMRAQFSSFFFLSFFFFPMSKHVFKRTDKKWSGCLSCFVLEESDDDDDAVNVCCSCN
jgi:hypothetical protein